MAVAAVVAVVAVAAVAAVVAPVSHLYRTVAASNLNCATHRSVASLNSLDQHRIRSGRQRKLDSIYSSLGPPHPPILPAFLFRDVARVGGGWGGTGWLHLLTWLLCAILNAHAASWDANGCGEHFIKRGKWQVASGELHVASGKWYTLPHVQRENVAWS